MCVWSLVAMPVVFAARSVFSPYIFTDGLCVFNASAILPMCCSGMLFMTSVSNASDDEQFVYQSGSPHVATGAHVPSNSYLGLFEVKPSVHVNSPSYVVVSPPWLARSSVETVLTLENGRK